MTPDLIAQAEAALGSARVIDLVPALIARIRELEGQNRELALDVLASSGQAQEAYEAQLAAEAKLAEVEAKLALVIWQRDQYRDICEQREKIIQARTARYQAAEAAVATLTAQVEVMRPLVAQLAAMPIGPATADDVPIYGLDGVYITHAHVRAARAALTTENPNG